jgi:hypothetical protein
VPSSASIASHLLDGKEIQAGVTVKQARWSAAAMQWQLSGIVGMHKDSPSSSAPQMVDLGTYDALVIADAAAMREGSAGYVLFEAEGDGSCL